MLNNLIIYGGAGFIGSHIVEDLIEREFNITVFDKSIISKDNIVRHLNKVDYIEGDFNNINDIKKSIKGKNYVIHLVSTTLPADSNVKKIYDVETNLISTLKLLDECVNNNIKKIIFISSGGTVYGRVDKNPITEEHSTNPLCSYGIVKLAIEKYLNLYKYLYGLDYSILRFSNPFGEGQNPHKGQGLIATALNKISKRDVIEIWGDGSIIRDYIYIADAVKSVYRSIRYNSDYDIFNIGSGIGYSINEILKIFRNRLNVKFKVKYLPSRKSDVPINILSNRRAKEYLGWEPEIKFEDAIHKTWLYYKS